MIILFPFLRAKGLRRFLLIMRTCIFLTLLYVGVTYKSFVYTWCQNILRDCSTDSLYCSDGRGKVIWRKQYQNETARIQRRESVTVSDAIARKSTLRRCCQSICPVVEPLLPPSLSPIPWTRLLSSANASVVIVEVFVIIFL